MPKRFEGKDLKIEYHDITNNEIFLSETFRTQRAGVLKHDVSIELDSPLKPGPVLR
jgi:hypothetical protein